jgi:hypothetical protein
LCPTQMKVRGRPSGGCGAGTAYLHANSRALLLRCCGGLVQGADCPLVPFLVTNLWLLPPCPPLTELSPRWVEPPPYMQEDPLDVGALCSLCSNVTC